jgi:hypothetical protein
MKEEITVEYDSIKNSDMVMVRSLDPHHKEEDESQVLKLLYIKDFMDDTGFSTMQIQQYMKGDEIVAVIVYGRHMSGLSQIHVHEVGKRFYPHLTIVSQVYSGYEGLKMWEKEFGLAGLTDNIKNMISKAKEEE